MGGFFLFGYDYSVCSFGGFYGCFLVKVGYCFVGERLKVVMHRFYLVWAGGWLEVI